MARKYGPWEIGNSIDGGGQAYVYEATDLTGEHPGTFALKWVKNPKRRERFLNEVHAVKTLKHPNVIPLIDHSALDALPTDKERQFIVMPVAAGGNLAKAAARFKGDAKLTIKVARQIAQALAAAHAKGIIHRDVKPANILFQTEAGDEIWVGDFGICLIDDGRDRQTEVGERPGPAMFMAPELEDGGQLDVGPEADVYSLGKVIFFMLSGGMILPREKLRDSPYREVLAAPGLARLNSVLASMICEDRTARMKTMNEVIAALDSIEAGLDAAGKEPSVDDAAERLMKNEAAKDAEIAAARKAMDDKDAAVADACRIVVETVSDQLLKLVQNRDEPGKTAFRVERGGGAGKRTLNGRIVLATDAVQVRRERYDQDKRTWVMTFHVFRRPGGDKIERVGLFADLEVRETDGRLVSQCRSLIGRRALSGARYDYFLTSVDAAQCEQPTGDWVSSDAMLRKIISDLFIAFLEFIPKGATIFAQAKFQEGNRGRRSR
jgi:serine/threonine protein kinase